MKILPKLTWSSPRSWRQLRAHLQQIFLSFLSFCLHKKCIYREWKKRKISWRWPRSWRQLRGELQVNFDKIFTILQLLKKVEKMKKMSWSSPRSWGQLRLKFSPLAPDWLPENKEPIRSQVSSLTKLLTWIQLKSFRPCFVRLGSGQLQMVVVTLHTF